MKKTSIATALGIVIGGASMSANAALTSSTTLDFTLGTPEVTACNYGTALPCANKAYNLTDIVGSWFSMGSTAPGAKVAIGSLNGIHLGTTQLASGSHSGAPGSQPGENPNIDNPWLFTSNTGMHQTLIAPTVAASADYTAGANIDLNGWNVTWNGIASIDLVMSSATITCDTASCSDSSNYTIDGSFHVNGAKFTSVAYTLHLEGHVVSAVPVPAAVWLFGSGLLGLVGVARRRKSS